MTKRENDFEVISLYLDGLRVKDIKEKTGCGDVYKVLKRNGIEKTRAKDRKLTDKFKDAVVADYLAGVTTREIVKKYKTYELYRILNERGIEYKQNNDKQQNKYLQTIELYLKGEKIETIEKIIGCKFDYRILKKFGLNNKRNPKDYNTNRKESRNKKIVEYYESGIDVGEIAKKYNVSKTNIIRILKFYGIEYKRKTNNTGNSSTIISKIKKNPNMKCKFYILEDYYGYTKIGITTKNKVKERYKKDVKVFYILEDTIKKCYDVEYKLKKKLKIYNPNSINKNIDGWTECYTLPPEEIITFIET